DSRRDARYPIVLVIHGEGWEWGSGNEFDGAALASLGNHIVVTFNYRSELREGLGPLEKKLFRKTLLKCFCHLQRLGTMEGDIVPYVMGLPVTNNIPAQGLNQHVSPFAALANFSKQDAFVAEMFLHYVANFVKSG
ncbi:Neuroligin-1, partial [Folsomia candida]